MSKDLSDSTVNLVAFATADGGKRNKIDHVHCGRGVRDRSRGQIPPHGTMWTIRNSMPQIQGIPAYAIVFALVCLLGLLFPLIKETRHGGSISVTAVGNGLHYNVLPPPGPETIVWAM